MSPLSRSSHSHSIAHYCPRITLSLTYTGDQEFIDARLNVTWRTLHTQPEILEALHSLLTSIDKSHSLLKEVSETRARGAYRTLPVPNHRGTSDPMIVRLNSPSRKSMEKNPVGPLQYASLASADVSYLQKYFGQFMVIICHIVRLVDRQEHEKLRATHFSLGIPTAQLKKWITDIALTINMHPATFGFESESDGVLFVGADVRLRIYRAVNLFLYAAHVKETRPDPKSKGTLEAVTLKTDNLIPLRIIRMDKCVAKIRVVLVIEHRNLGKGLQWMQDNLKDAVIVMVTYIHPLLSYCMG